MKSQIEKNKEILMEEMERYAGQKLTDANATRLCTFLGAYKALNLVCEHSNGEEEESAPAAVREAVGMTKTGDSDFMCIIGETKIDTQHLNAIFEILDDHLTALEIMNNRAYRNLIARLREVSMN